MSKECPVSGANCYVSTCEQKTGCIIQQDRDKQFNKLAEGLYETRFVTTEKPEVFSGLHHDAPQEIQGVRFDAGKLRYDLIPPEALEELAIILSKGAIKYAPHNWEKGILYSRVIGSLFRHLIAWMRGQDTDSETGCHHMGHVMCNAMFIVTFWKRGQGAELDNQRNKTHPQYNTKDFDQKVR